MSEWWNGKQSLAIPADISSNCRSGGMVDTRALRARGDKTPWRFESSLRHLKKINLYNLNFFS